MPHDAIPQIALVGRSNVGKSSLINALAKARIARTSAAPGKTTLINVYRIRLGGRSGAPGGGGPVRLYFVDLPGYGYARGGAPRALAFGRLTGEYFGAVAPIDPRDETPAPSPRRRGAHPNLVGAILTVDGRHPGLANDLEAVAWLTALGLPFIVVATKVDRMSRADRLRAHRELETIMHGPVLPVSAVSGEGLEELWKSIIKLVRA